MRRLPAEFRFDDSSEVHIRRDTVTGDVILSARKSGSAWSDFFAVRDQARVPADTDTVSYLIRGRTPALDARMAAVPPRLICISAVTRGEVLYGLSVKVGAHRLAALVDQFLVRVQCLLWDEAAATQFAFVAAELHRAGMQIGQMDCMIAGHAKSLGAVLVTNKVLHHTRVAGLKVESWCR